MMFEQLAQVAGWPFRELRTQTQSLARPVSTSCCPPGARVYTSSHRSTMGKRARSNARFVILDIVCGVLLWTTVSCRVSDTARVAPAPTRDVILITIDTLR